MMTRPKIENPMFFKLLKKEQLIPEDFIADLLAELEGNALDVLATLIQSGVGTKRHLCQLWCDSIGIAHVDLEKSLFQPHVVRRLPERFARKHYAIPIYQMGDTVTVATPIPENIPLKKEIESLIKNPVNLVFALPQDIEWAIENEYQTNTALYEFFSKISTSKVFGADNSITEKTFVEIAGKDSIHQFHVCIILLGITEHASEINIDPEAQIARINFIIHGVFNERLQIDKSVHRHLVNSLKTMAKIKDTQGKDALYSRIIFPTPGKKFDIQFLSLPTDFGEKIFLKLMDREALQTPPELSNLYLAHKQKKQLDGLLGSKNGILLISGPSASDFNSLAYAVIREIRSLNPGKIITVEDSPAFLLKEIDQYQVNPKANFTRAEALRSGLSLHPDVIYVQNINDPEVTGPLRQAAEKGIRVIAGITAEDAFDALNTTKLGIGSVITAIIHQQMVRRLCDHCKEKYPLPQKEIGDLFIYDGHPAVSAWRAVGCPYCRHTGYHGHIGVQELIVIDESIRCLIRQNATINEIKIASIKTGFQTREYDGIKKALRGLTSFDEIKNPGNG